MTLGKWLLRAAACRTLPPQQDGLLLAMTVAAGRTPLDKAFTGVELEFQPEAANSEACGTSCPQASRLLGP